MNEFQCFYIYKLMYLKLQSFRNKKFLSIIEYKKVEITEAITQEYKFIGK